MNIELLPNNYQLVIDIRQLIEGTRQAVSQTMNSGMTMLYWHIGKRITDDLLANQRADYGKQIVVSLAHQLRNDYGRGFDEKSLRRMIPFAEIFPDTEIVATIDLVAFC